MYWSHSLQSSCCGRLAPLSTNSWSTTNKPAVVYVRPKTHREIVRNAILIHNIGIYDHLKKQLISPLNSLANCDIKKGSCIIGNRVYIWKVPDKLDCPRVKQIRTVHNVTLLLDNFKNVYRAEIKQLGISLHSQTTCPCSVFNCFPKNSVCDPTGIIHSSYSSQLFKTSSPSFNKIFSFQIKITLPQISY